MKWALPAGNTPWAASAIDEFVRIFSMARGRAAFYAAARHIYLDEPHGEKGFWTKLEQLSPDSLFLWGRHDRFVSTGFMKHVERALPAAQHVELDCGHIPQLERPRQTHAAIEKFLRAQAA
jgi:pimeloyl-ACP methyl ester carboxylesterase